MQGDRATQPADYLERSEEIDMPTIEDNGAYATFINVFRCRPEDQDEVVRIHAEIIDRVAVGRPGFISASLHRSVDGTRVFNYLQWESAADLARMQDSAEFRRIASRFAGMIDFEPHQCTIAHIGENPMDRGR